MYCVCIGYLKFSVKYSVKFLLELKLFSDYYRTVMLSRLFLNHMQSMIVERKSGSISFMTIQSNKLELLCGTVMLSSLDSLFFELLQKHRITCLGRDTQG